jgi:hypothetical protein
MPSVASQSPNNPKSTRKEPIGAVCHGCGFFTPPEWLFYFGLTLVLLDNSSGVSNSSGVQGPETIFIYNKRSLPTARGTLKENV